MNKELSPLLQPKQGWNAEKDFFSFRWTSQTENKSLKLTQGKIKYLVPSAF